MRLILPLILAVLGLAGGLGAGWLLRPAPPPVETAEAADIGLPSPLPPQGGTEVLRLPSQFLVPLIGEGRVRAMMALGLALELASGHLVDLGRDEPRLRSVFLQILFDHANLGGFDGVFTSGEQLLALRRTLLEAARREFGPGVHDVLIIELMRQDS